MSGESGFLTAGTSSKSLQSRTSSEIQIEFIKSVGGSALMHKTSILLLMGIILLSPFLWVHLDGRSVTLAVIQATSHGSKETEVSEQRILLGGHSLILENEVERPCSKPGKKAHVPKLEVIHQWLSNKEFARESVTLMTQLSSDRMSMLENQCRAWSDPLIAIVYVPLNKPSTKNGKPTMYDSATSLDDVVRGISSFHSYMEKTASCILRIELVGQYIEDERRDQYPINSLRNKAMALARTDLVMVLDVDFVASPLLGLPSPGYKDPAVYEQMVGLTRKKKALVIPAFEITNRRQDLVMAQNYARNMVVAGKEEVKKGYKAGTLDAFNAHDAPWGHGPTNTSKWIRLSRPVLYKVEYAPKYEPFVILARDQAPWCDERFVGYGGNKIAYIKHLEGLGFDFHVHPYGYAIHVPHHRTRAADRFVAHKKSGNAEMDTLRLEVEQEIDGGQYVPVVAGCEEKDTSRKKKRKADAVE